MAAEAVGGYNIEDELLRRRLRGLSPNDYPDARVRVEILLAAAGRLNHNSAAHLNQDEVIRLQQAGFMSALAAV